MAHFFKNLFVGEILYTLVIVTVKYSILAFYYRIFNTKAVRIQALSLSALTTAWGIAVVSLYSISHNFAAQKMANVLTEACA